jgi:hypothetical protein
MRHAVSIHAIGALLGGLSLGYARNGSCGDACRPRALSTTIAPRSRLGATLPNRAVPGGPGGAHKRLARLR